MSADPKFVPQWKGGEVTGVVTAAPSDVGFFARITGKAPPARPMIVAALAAPGLEPTVPPQPPTENSSRWYAGQWFFFALTAALIYILALRRRRTSAVEAEPKQP